MLSSYLQQPPEGQQQSTRAIVTKSADGRIVCVVSIHATATIIQKSAEVIKEATIGPIEEAAESAHVAY